MTKDERQLLRTCISNGFEFHSDDRKQVKIGDEIFDFGRLNELVTEVESALDAEPVVRCGECRYAHLTTDGELAKYCDMWRDEDQIAMELYLPADFYCAYAKEKNEA